MQLRCQLVLFGLVPEPLVGGVSLEAAVNPPEMNLIHPLAFLAGALELKIELKRKGDRLCFLLQ